MAYAPLKVAATVTAATTAAAGKHLPVNAVSAPVTITLPTGQRDGATLAVEKTDAGTNTVTLSGSIRGSASTIVLSLAHETVSLVADSAGSWWPIAGHKTLTSLDSRFVTSAAVTSTYLARQPVGVNIPQGALGTWQAARESAKTGGSLAEVMVFGDSVTWGQTATGTNGATTSANNWSIIGNGLRVRAIAAGYADGGTGLQHGGYLAAQNPTDNIAAITGTTVGFTMTGTGGFNTAGTLKSAAVGDTVTVQGKGTTMRLFRRTNSTGNGAFTYSVNGGTAVAVDDTAAARQDRVITVTGLPGGGATNTVTVTITTAGTVEFSAEWVNAGGIVWHNHSHPGVTMTNTLAYGGGIGMVAAALGVGLGQNPFGSILTYTKTGPRVPALAILNLGLNDQATAATTQAAAINTAEVLTDSVWRFAELVQNAGCSGLVCLPHLAYFTNAMAYAGTIKTAIRTAAIAEGMAVADLQSPLRPTYNASTWAATVAGSPHLNAAGYQAQSDWLWTNVLSQTF